MEIVYLGHSSFLIKGSSEIVVDPFITNNPGRDRKGFPHISPNFVLVTHAHGDHLGDTFEIASKNDSEVVCIYEIAQYLQSKGLRNVHSMNIGGKLDTKFGFLKMVPALHSSSIVEDGRIIYGGLACGFVVNIDGKMIYHAGDTALFSDMKLIGDTFNIDVALLPVGGNFTMDVFDAIESLKILKPKVVIPMHYGTWPIIDADIDKFIFEAEKLNIKGVKLKTDEIYRL